MLQYEPKLSTSFLIVRFFFKSIFDLCGIGRTREMNQGASKMVLIPYSSVPEQFSFLSYTGHYRVILCLFLIIVFYILQHVFVIILTKAISTIAREVFSLVIMGNGKQVLPVLH